MQATIHAQAVPRQVCCLLFVLQADSHSVKLIIDGSIGQEKREWGGCCSGNSLALRTDRNFGGIKAKRDVMHGCWLATDATTLGGGPFVNHGFQEAHVRPLQKASRCLCGSGTCDTQHSLVRMQQYEWKGSKTRSSTERRPVAQ